MKGTFTKHYDGRAVLDGFTLDIHEGDIVRIMAPSGGGKTTLLRLVSGLEENECGLGNDFSGHTFSWVFQEDRLTDSMSGLSNIRLVTRGKVDRATILCAFEELGLDDPSKRVDECSGGMKRRMALIRAMLDDGDVIILDEPFTGLDRDARILACRFIEHHRHGRTLLLVSHEDDEVLPIHVDRTVSLLP